MNWLLQHRYAFLLVAILLLFVGFPVTRGIVAAHWAFNLLYTAVFLIAILGLARRRRKRRLAILLGTPAMLVAWFGMKLPWVSPLATAAVFHLLTAAFLVYVVTTILMSIYNQERITADSICGAFSGYLLTGVAFGHIFSFIERVDPTAFTAPDNARMQMRQDDERYFMLTYFSFVTLTTVGYGEITPASEFARSLCAVEAIVGQFYIAVLVADLIGKKLSQAVAHSAQQHPGNRAPPDE